MLPVLHLFIGRGLEGLKSGRLKRPHRGLIPGCGAVIVGVAAGGRHYKGDKGNMVDFAGIAGDQLKLLIERIERLEEDKRALGEDIKEVYAEAKGTGFEPKIMRQLIKIRKMGKGEANTRQ